MTRHLMGVCAAIALLALVLSSCSDEEYIGITDLPEINLSNVAITEVRNEGSTGKLALNAAPDKFLLVFFGFTNCPDICPTTLADLREARRQLGNQANRIEVAFITVDRERDTAPVLSSYLSQYQFGDAGHALRPADDAELASATRPLFATSEVSHDAEVSRDANSTSSPRVNHTAWTYIVDSEGRVVLEWGYPTSSKDMAHDLRLLLRS